MPKPNTKPLRGLQEIRTNAGKVDHLSHPHMAYMRISCLEMEKARKKKEKESALRRVASIDDRLREIETEKKEIEKVLERKEAAEKAMRARVSPDGAGSGEERDYFKIRY